MKSVLDFIDFSKLCQTQVKYLISDFARLGITGV